MNLIQISNLFNQICLGINATAPETIGFYHYGWYSDINSEIVNNWTGAGNPLGKKFPSVQMLYPTATIEVKEKSVKGSIDCRMIVSDLQYYDNTAQYRNESILETQGRLEALAVNILSEYNRIARTMQTGVQNPITIDYLSDAHNNNLVLLDIKFRIWYVWDCPTITADISALPAPFDSLPPAVSDLEKYQIDYCTELGLSQNIGLGVSKVGNTWSAAASLFDFVNEITSHPQYAGNLSVITSTFTDTAGDPVGTITVIGNDTYCDQIPLSVFDVIYQMEVSAQFNIGVGVRTIRYTLSLQMAQPLNIAVDYSTNTYICQDYLS